MLKKYHNSPRSATAVAKKVAINGIGVAARLIREAFGRPMLAGDMGSQAVLVLEAVAALPTLYPLLRDVVRDEVLAHVANVRGHLVAEAALGPTVRQPRRIHFEKGVKVLRRR